MTSTMTEEDCWNILTRQSHAAISMHDADLTFMSDTMFFGFFGHYDQDRQRWWWGEAVGTELVIWPYSEVQS